MHLYGENVEMSFSQNVLKTKGWNLQCMIKLLKLKGIKGSIGTQGEVGRMKKCFKPPGGLFYWPF